jgi:hypothetical protein
MPRSLAPGESCDWLDPEVEPVASELEAPPDAQPAAEEEQVPPDNVA